MTWVRLDDQFADHPKVTGLSCEAFRLHITAMCWTSAQLTDGVVPFQAMRRLGWFCNDPQTAASELVESGAWDLHPDGYIIHDYLDYNPSREQVQKERTAARERMAHKRGSSLEVHPNKTGSSESVQLPPSPSPSPESNTRILSNSGDTEVAPSGAAPAPDPAPEPVVEPEPAPEPKPKKPRAVPEGGQSDMFGAIAEACDLDAKLKAGQIAKAAKSFLQAGYTPAQVRAFPLWWQIHDWRGQRGDVPTLAQLTEKIKQSTNGAAPPVTTPQRNGQWATLGERQSADYKLKMAALLGD